ncbi:HAD family hydrolase [Paenibacillus filicis]|uniref:HAD family hydrolase n=1 Tax=Paenibacillus gyeongsangnamensis TaxID=3388067 RepID=A0ABT4QGD4_9BACL|nr:HAD family hydrolase [Paenibacillus filicis]MCZ8515940.1 HAD family hydrolase [Paenibacillus filicis]
MIKAIVFDFDGLIIDTETAWFHAFQEAFELRGADFPMEVFVKCIGTDDTLLDAYIGQRLGEREVGEIKQSAQEIHRTKMKDIALRDGVEHYLTRAKELGLKIGLASSSSRAWVEGWLKEFRLYEYFQVIKTGDEVEKVKPDPALYVEAVKALDVSAAEAVAFEDSPNGAKAAVKAGLRCVIVPNGVTENLQFEAFDLRIGSMSEVSLEQLIRELEQ